MTVGIELFKKRLHPTAVAEIKSWAENPQLSKLLQKLESVSDAQHFLNHYAEAMVARHLIKNECRLEVEVSTVNGRSADFRVSKDNNTFFLHVKRLNVDEQTRKEMKVHNRLEELRKIRKPLIFGVVFFRCLTDGEMQGLYKRAKKFIKNAGIGEKMVVEDTAGQRIAECEIRGCRNVERVQLIVAMSVKHADDVKRLYGKLSDAYKQFMPKAANVVLVTSNWKEDVEDFEESLLGSRGFWEGNKHHDSNVVVWFNFDTKDDYINFRIWYREKCEIPKFIQKLFEARS